MNVDAHVGTMNAPTAVRLACLVCALVATTTQLAAQDSSRATVTIIASVSAREVRFAKPPRISVRLHGATLDTVRVIERRNLPERVQPGVTYRNVYVAVEILAHLETSCAATAGQPERGLLSLCASLRARDSLSVRREPER